MASKNVLFMTSEETERVKTTVQDHVRKCQEQIGQLWQPSDSKTLVQEAISISLMQDMASAAFGLGVQNNDQEKMPAYAVGRPYLPCTVNLQDLAPISLPDLRMETHHRGCVLKLRRISPVVELKTFSWMVTQGESPNEATRLEIFLHNSAHGQTILDLGSEFIVKEPYYTLNSQGAHNSNRSFFRSGGLYI